MATVNFIRYKEQSAAALKGVTEYVAQKEKTLPRPSPGWLFLPLMLAALLAVWYNWGVLWSILSPIFT